jgi:hypothetical protein
MMSVQWRGEKTGRGSRRGRPGLGGLEEKIRARGSLEDLMASPSKERELALNL